MDSNVSIILKNIANEIEHSRCIEDSFLCALGLFETRYKKRPSSLLEPYPEFVGIMLTDAEAAEMKQAVIRFIETLPNHGSITAAIWLLAVTRDQTLKAFFVAKLRLYLGWRNPTVVSTLLLALEDLGERVYYTADGAFIGSRSSIDTDTNFGCARRYLENYDRAA